MFFLSLLIVAVSSKTLNSRLTFTENNFWQPITGFGATLGTGNFTFRARLSAPAEDTQSELKIKLVLYLGSDWAPTIAKSTCKDRMIESIKTYSVVLPANSEWTTAITGKLTQKQKPQVWYFVLADCDEVLANKRIKYEFSIVNPGNEHFSVERIGLSKVYWIAFLILFLLLGKNTYEFVLKFNKDGDVSGPMIWLNCSVIFQMLGVGFYCLHYYVYTVDGEGVMILELFGDVFCVLASVAVSTLMVVVANGWTLVYKDFPVPELYIPGFFLVFFCQMVTSGMDSLQEKTSFSQYEGWKGFIGFFVRILMFFWFLSNLYKTSQSKDAKKGGFFYLFGIGSSCYFLAIPLLVFGSYSFPVHQREIVMTGGTQCIQVIVSFFLYKLFTGKGDYYKMNTVLNILPGSRPHTY